MSFPKYEVYKDSGVEWLGEVPEHWDVAPLKYLVSTPVTDGPHETPNFIDGGVLFISAEAVSSGKIDFNKAKYISREDHNRFSKKYKPQKFDIYMVKSGATTGITAIFETDEEFNIWSPLAVIRCSQNYHPYFVLFSMRSRSFQESVVLHWSFGTQQNIGMSVIENLPITYPPREEQTQIARFLDHETARIDALVAEQQRLIELLKEKRQAVISHAVTKGLDPNAPMKHSDVEWLGEVPEHWDIAKVKHVIQSFEQGWSPQCDNVPIENDKEWGVLKVGCVNGGIFSPTENKRLPDDLEPIPELFLKAGDVLISRANTRELVGNAALVDSDQPNLMLSDKLFRLRTTGDTLPKYLVFYLGTSAVRYQIELDATGASSSMLNIGQAIIKELPIPVPPVNEQQDIETRLEASLNDLYLLQKEAQLTQKLLQERRSALISAAVTGKIDVRGWQAPASAAPAPTLEVAQG